MSTMRAAHNRNTNPNDDAHLLMHVLVIIWHLEVLRRALNHRQRLRHRGEDSEVPRDPRAGAEPAPFTLAGGGDDVPVGVEGLDCGIGGSDSSNEAPKEEVGLKALRPVKPVVWGCNGVVEEENAEVAAVLPVG